MSQYLSLAGTLFFTAYVQLIVKARSGMRTSTETSNAYPFMALSFVLVPAGAVLFLGEKIRLIQAVGIGLIVAGVVINAPSQ